LTVPQGFTSLKINVRIPSFENQLKLGQERAKFLNIFLVVWVDFVNRK